MRESRLSPLAGVAFVIALGAAVGMMGNTAFMPEAEEALDLFSDRWAVVAGAYLGALSAFFLLWFAGSLRSHLESAGDPRLAALAFGGGVFAAATIAIGIVPLAAGAERLAIGGGLSPDAATTLLDLSGVVVGNASPYGFAAMLLATAIVAFRTAFLARWAAWITLIGAVGLLTPVNWAVLAFPVVWVPVMGAVLSRRKTPDLRAAAASLA